MFSKFNPIQTTTTAFKNIGAAIPTPTALNIPQADLSVINNVAMDSFHAVGAMHDFTAKILSAIPSTLADSKLPVISTVGQATKTVVNGATTMTDIVVDHFGMTGLEVVHTATTLTEGAINITGRVLSNPADIGKAIFENDRCGCEGKPDSVSEVIEEILTYEHHMIKAHLDHDVLLVRTPFDTAHKLVTETAEALHLAPIVNPIADALYAPIAFTLDDVVHGVVIDGGMAAWKLGQEAIFGEMSDSGVMQHSYTNNLSTAKPTSTDILLSKASANTLDHLFGNNGAAANEKYVYSHHDTTNPTFIESISNRAANLLPTLYTTDHSGSDHNHSDIPTAYSTTNTATLPAMDWSHAHLTIM